jgi:hypothetical protein
MTTASLDLRAWVRRVSKEENKPHRSCCRYANELKIRFWREGAATRHDVLAIDGEMNVESVLSPSDSDRVAIAFRQSAMRRVSGTKDFARLILFQ